MLKIKVLINFFVFTLAVIPLSFANSAPVCSGSGSDKMQIGASGSASISTCRLSDDSIKYLDETNPIAPLTDVYQNNLQLVSQGGKTPRIHSWASPMTWATNVPFKDGEPEHDCGSSENTSFVYATGKKGSKGYCNFAFQKPIMADPLVAFYSSQSGVDVKKYISSGDNITSNLYGQGFHISTQNPLVGNSMIYQAGNGPGSYNYTNRIKHDSNDLQAGFTHISLWIETIFLYPNELFDESTPKTSNKMSLNASVVDESDYSIKFRMCDQTSFSSKKYCPDDSSSSLDMTITKGSPFLFFENKSSASDNKITIGSAGSYTGTFSSSQSGVNSAIFYPKNNCNTDNNLCYAVIFQQANNFITDGMQLNTSGTSLYSNWLSYAVYWYSASGKDNNALACKNGQNTEVTNPYAKSSKNHGSVVICKTNGTNENIYYQLDLGPNKYFTVAALPNQTSNSKPTYNFNFKLARRWSDLLSNYAFNFITDTSVSFYSGSNGSSAPGGDAGPNDVVIEYKNTLSDKANPSSQGGDLKTVYLLQPHQYRSFDLFESSNKQTITPLVFGSQSANVKASKCRYNSTNFIRCLKSKANRVEPLYWFIRGHLEPYISDKVTLKYKAPPIIPYFPAKFFTNDKGDFVSTEESCGSKYCQSTDSPIDCNLRCNLNSMSYLLGLQSAYNTFINDGPAATKLKSQWNDPYGSGQAIYSAAKFLSIFKDTQLPEFIPYWFAGQKGSYSKVNLQQSSKNEVLYTLYEGIKDSFEYYFTPSISSVNSVTNKGGLKTYIYSFYNPSTKHLTLYPSGTAAGNNPYPISATGVTDGIFDAFGIASKISDNHYTWGYFINAAAMFAMSLKDSTFDEILAIQESSEAKNKINKNWWDENNYGPAIDLMIQDIAYTDKINDDETITWWVDSSNIKFPKYEFMEVWSGTAYTDAFGLNSQFGKQHNSAQEAQLSWAGIYLWGTVTNRKNLAALGKALYTLGAYSNAAYMFNALGTLTPSTSSSDYSKNDDFIIRATATEYKFNNEVDGKCSKPNINYTLNNISSSGTQPKSSTSISTYFAPGVYQGMSIYQGEDGMPPLNALLNLILPFEPITMNLTMFDTDYQKAMVQNAKGGSTGSNYSLAYSGAINAYITALSSYSGSSLGNLTYQKNSGFNSSDCSGVPFECYAKFTQAPSSGDGGVDWFMDILTGKSIDLKEHASSSQSLYPWSPLKSNTCPALTSGGGVSQTSININNFFTVGTLTPSYLTDFYMYQNYKPSYNVTCTSDSTTIAPICQKLTDSDSSDYYLLYQSCASSDGTHTITIDNNEIVVPCNEYVVAKGSGVIKKDIWSKATFFSWGSSDSLKNLNSINQLCSETSGKTSTDKFCVEPSNKEGTNNGLPVTPDLRILFDRVFENTSESKKNTCTYSATVGSKVNFDCLYGDKGSKYSVSLSCGTVSSNPEITFACPPEYTSTLENLDISESVFQFQDNKYGKLMEVTLPVGETYSFDQYIDFSFNGNVEKSLKVNIRNACHVETASPLEIIYKNKNIEFSSNDTLPILGSSTSTETFSLPQITGVNCISSDLEYKLNPISSVTFYTSKKNVTKSNPTGTSGFTIDGNEIKVDVSELSSFLSGLFEDYKSKDGNYSSAQILIPLLACGNSDCTSQSQINLKFSFLPTSAGSCVNIITGLNSTEGSSPGKYDISWDISTIGEGTCTAEDVNIDLFQIVGGSGNATCTGKGASSSAKFDIASVSPCNISAGGANSTTLEFLKSGDVEVDLKIGDNPIPGTGAHIDIKYSKNNPTCVVPQLQIENFNPSDKNSNKTITISKVTLPSGCKDKVLSYDYKITNPSPSSMSLPSVSRNGLDYSVNFTQQGTLDFSARACVDSTTCGEYSTPLTLTYSKACSIESAPSNITFTPSSVATPSSNKITVNWSPATLSSPDCATITYILDFTNNSSNDVTVSNINQKTYSADLTFSDKSSGDYYFYIIAKTDGDNPQSKQSNPRSTVSYQASQETCKFKTNPSNLVINNNVVTSKQRLVTWTPATLTSDSSPNCVINYAVTNETTTPSGIGASVDISQTNKNAELNFSANGSISFAIEATTGNGMTKSLATNTVNATYKAKPQNDKVSIHVYKISDSSILIQPSDKANLSKVLSACKYEGQSPTPFQNGAAIINYRINKNIPYVTCSGVKCSFSYIGIACKF